MLSIDCLSQYLSPEPLLQNPEYVRRMAQSGLSVPTYAYALNNPVKYVDPDGKHPILIGLAVGGAFILYESWALNRAQKLGRAESDRLYPGLQAGPRDAIRHCLASCEAAVWAGTLPAALAGYANELPLSRNNQRERATDLHNNRCGRRYSFGFEDCLTSCKRGLESGELVQGSTDVQYPTWQEMR